MDPAWIALIFTAVGMLMGTGVAFGIAMAKLDALAKVVDKLAEDHEERIRALEKQRLPLFVHAGGHEVQQ